jgi:tetratricopeptide (TPR) repeat protein
MSLFTFGCVAAVFFAWERRQRAKAEVKLADQLFEDGQPAEAVAIYKKRYDYVPDDRKAEILGKIIDQAVRAGDRSEAVVWITRALDESHTISSPTDEVRELIAEVRQQREPLVEPEAPEPASTEQPPSAEPEPVATTPETKPAAPEPLESPSLEENLSERQRKRLENIRRTEAAKAAAVRRRPETAANMLENAERLRRLGKDDEADKWIRKVIDNYPETEAAEKAKEVLKAHKATW